jgi:signal transduction histidine kinase
MMNGFSAMHPKSWHILQIRIPPLWTRIWPLGELARRAWEGAQAAWGELTPIDRYATLVALACGAAVSSGRLDGGVPQAVLAIIEFGMVALLIAIVGQAGEDIASKRRAARDWSSEKAGLVAHNAELRRQIDDCHRRAVDINDKVLRRVGVELHDGPAQLISLALLRLDSLHPERAANRDASLDEYERIRDALQDALAEIRCMSAGLTLPELNCVSPSDALRLAVRNHERRTATSVRCEVDGLPHDVPVPIKSCLYRFAQEALNNAYRHAGGSGQEVRGNCRGNTIEVEVADAGPGFEPGNEIAGNHLGLLGMRERVAALGGTLEIVSRPGAGTRLTTRFKMPECGAGQGQTG